MDDATRHHPALLATHRAVEAAGAVERILSAEGLSPLFEGLEDRPVAARELMTPAIRSLRDAITELEQVRDGLIRDAIKRGVATRPLADASGIDRRTIEKRRRALLDEGTGPREPGPSTDTA